ncbi:uncharacterized protein [Temnothorax longispinosus]|uniref:uncharacterized protein isoform X3 n=1 Tax=Temnothorax longispinosus TaxID=300112 RepID=UPI003A99B04C
MAENAHKPEKAVPCCSTVEHPKLISLSEEHSNLISVANKFFGAGKWSHTVVKQALYFHNINSNEVDSDDEYIDELIHDEINTRNKYRFKGVSYIKIQLENGNCYEDDGFYIAEESTKGLSIQNARIGSAVSALKRVLLSFGDKVERELQQLQKQISSEQVNTFAAAEPMDLAINYHDLISVANKVFGEGKWNHTVVRQTLDFNDIDLDNVDFDDVDFGDANYNGVYFDDVDYDVDYDISFRDINARTKYCVGCVSYVKIQLENGNFHEDIGYINADKFTEGFSIQTVRIGSAINGLFRVLLSFGDKVERELKQLRRQIGSEQVNTFTAAEPMDLAINFHDLISVANKIFGEGKWNHTLVRQILDSLDADDEVSLDEEDRKKYCVGCVSYVKIQLENGNFHEDIGYFDVKEWKGLSIQTVRIGSATNALFRVLLSFGDKVERELKLRRQIGYEQVNTFTAAEPMDVAMNFYDLISMANKVFGEGKWNHTVVSQTLDFIDTYDINYTAGDRYDQDKSRIGCVSFVKVQLENGNFHGDVGYFNAEELTRGLSTYNARIGSAINGLKRVLLSFGDKVERELKQLRRQIGSEQVNTFDTAESTDLATNFLDLISVANTVFGEGKWNHTVVRQTLDCCGAYQFDSDGWSSDLSNCEINVRNKYCAGCVSYVKVQLENGNFHEDIGYINAYEFTKDLLMQNARMGSAVNALKRVLLSFGDKVERELKLRRQIGFEQVNTFDTAESTNLATNFLDLISAANTVFGEGKWNHTVVRQTLDFDVDNCGVTNRGNYQRAGCVSSVKVQLENGNFHEDVGYFYAEEPTQGLLIYSARIGSAVNALRRVLLSFGDKVERELKQLRRQISSDQEPMDLAADFPDLISAANKVFGEGKWNHTVICQTLDFDYEDVFEDSDDIIHNEINVRNKHHVAGCVSVVKVQLENGNFHQDVGYFNAEEPKRNLSIYNAKIGSAVNALRRVLLSFGEKIDKELQRQVIPKQVSDIKRNATQSLVNTFVTAEPMDFIAEFPDLISAANKVFGEGNWRHTVVKQILDNNYAYGGKYYADCVSYVKVQLKNENFHMDVGYCSTKEPTRGLAILNVKIGSAVNALKRVLMSFGEQFERELQQLPRQISPEQTDDVQRDVA